MVKASDANVTHGEICRHLSVKVVDVFAAFAGFVGGSAMGGVGGALTKKTDP